MKKLSKKAKSSKKSLKETAALAFAKIRDNFAAHSVVVMFVLAGIAIGYSLLKSKQYLNPERDENKYSEVSAKSNYSKIDYKLVKKLQDSLDDSDIQVTQNLSPNRKNPFSE